MAETLLTAQRRRVYIHCRPIFSGVNAQVRKQKKIMELVNKNAASLQQLFNDIGQKKVIKILRYLLDKHIFEAEARAKVEFPDLFGPSSSLNVQRQASENDAAKTTEAALDSIAFCHSEGSVTDGMEDSEIEEDGGENGEAVNLVNGDKKVETLPRRCMLNSAVPRFSLLTSKASNRDTSIQTQLTLTISILPAISDPAPDSHGIPAGS